MSNIRTANRRHQRAITVKHARSKAAQKAAVAPGKPGKAALKS